jgi:hypothetical protein
MLYNLHRLKGDTFMHVFGAFELEIQPGTPDNPASVMLASTVPDSSRPL